MAIRAIIIDEQNVIADGTAWMNLAKISVLGPSGQYVVRASAAVNGIDILNSKSEVARYAIRCSLVVSFKFRRVRRLRVAANSFLLFLDLLLFSCFFLRMCKIIKTNALHRKALIETAEYNVINMV